MSKTILFLIIISFNVQANSLLQERWQFKDAYNALLNGNTLSIQLQNYPIVHYLRYFYLELHLEETNAIKMFLNQYKDSPIAKPLRESWLRYLAEKEDWKTFLIGYTPQNDTILQCQYLNALLQTQGINGLIDQATDLWLVGKSQPDECDPIFKYLYDNNIITKEIRWKRIRLAMQKGNIRLARFIAKGLSKSDKKLVALWYDMYRHPAKILKKYKLPNFILQYGLKRLARKNASQAYKYWKKYKIRFTKQENALLFYEIALKSAKQHHPKAAQWLDAVDEKLLDEQVKQAKLQIALAQQDWKIVKQLSKNQTDRKWQYWQARALEQSGEANKAEKLFQIVSKNRDYYGFLAANRIGMPYHFNFQPLIVNKTEQKKLLKKYAGLIRARELYFIGRSDLARVEWQLVLPSLNLADLKTAATLAHKWGWHDRAVITIAKAKYWHDLNIRFPVPFYDLVHTQAQKQELDAAYVYAIIRQESAYQTDARSSAGALGLMQLMPSTAKQVSKK